MHAWQAGSNIYWAQGAALQQPRFVEFTDNFFDSGNLFKERAGIRHRSLIVIWFLLNPPPHLRPCSPANLWPGHDDSGGRELGGRRSRVDR
jgi:hypothetical protein